jgi:hypothetical protein
MDMGSTEADTIACEGKLQIVKNVASISDYLESNETG